MVLKTIGQIMLKNYSEEDIYYNASYIACYALIQSHSYWNILFYVTESASATVMIPEHFTTSSKPSVITWKKNGLKFAIASIKRLYIILAFVEEAKPNNSSY
jgi:hypothetical protein